MNSQRQIEWKMLTGTLVLLFLSLLIDSALIISGLYYQEDAETNLQKLKKTITTLQMRKQQQNTQQQLLDKARPKFTELQAKQLIGPEPRMRWFETLKDAELALKLPAPIRFQLEPPHLHTPAFPISENTHFQLFSSQMKLNFGLLHEGDLFDLIHYLEQKKVGLFHIKQCTLQSVDTKSSQNRPLANEVNLQGNCTLDWFSFQNKENKNR